jgi:glycosyltransferase involved in cell wall biosynthesis
MDKTLNMPKITVLMPVYNGEKYLDSAVQSILSQTFKDFEFLIIDDGSTDGSAEIIRKFEDTRIKLVQNKKNLGLPTTLNLGLDIASGEYIARMDCDDISHPQRFEKQVEFMDNNPDVSICGTWMKTIGDKAGIVIEAPKTNEEIKCSLLFSGGIPHPTVFMRKKEFDRHNLRYSKDYLDSEDTELWIRALKYLQASSLQEVLYSYRIHPAQACRTDNQRKKETTRKIIREQLSDLLMSPSEDEIELHRTCLRVDNGFEKEEIIEIGNWLLKLKSSNEKAGVYQCQEFSYILNQRWFYICNSSTKHGIWILNEYMSSKINSLSFCMSNKINTVKFIIKSLLKY